MWLFIFLVSMGIVFAENVSMNESVMVNDTVNATNVSVVLSVLVNESGVQENVSFCNITERKYLVGLSCKDNIAEGDVVCVLAADGVHEEFRYVVMNASREVVDKGSAVEVSSGKYKFSFESKSEGAHQVIVFDGVSSTSIPLFIEEKSGGEKEVSVVKNDTAEARVLGTIYREGEQVKIVGACTRNDELVVSTANVTIFFPNNTIFVNNTRMTSIKTGLFNYTTESPNITGNYLVHIRCIIGPRVADAIAEFQIVEWAKTIGEADKKITTLNETVVNLLSKQFEFSQEEVFLITDAVNSIGTLIDSAELPVNMTNMTAVKKDDVEREEKKFVLDEKSNIRHIRPSSIWYVVVSVFVVVFTVVFLFFTRPRPPKQMTIQQFNTTVSMNTS